MDNLHNRLKVELGRKNEIAYCIVNIMRRFGRRDHVTKELIVFGHVGTKVHSRRCFLHTNLAEGNIKSTYLGDFFAMLVANCSIYGCATSRKHSGVGIFKFLQRQMNYRRKHVKLG